MTARPDSLLDTVGISVGFLLLMFGGGLWVGIYVSDVRLALVLYGGLGSATWLAASLVRPRLLPRSQMTGAFAAALGAFAISGALAWQPRLGLDYLAYAVQLTALYLMLVRIWAEPVPARRLDALVVVVTVLAAIGYVVEVGSSWVEYWRLIGGLAVPPLRPGYAGLWLGNPNALASLLILLWLHIAAESWEGAGRARRLAIAGLGALVAFDTLLSGSRGAWLGVGLAAVVGAAVWLAFGANRDRLASLGRSVRARAGIVGVAVATLVAVAIFGPAILDRLQAGAVEVRSAFWAATVRMIEARPLAGLGPGSWAPARIPYTSSTELDAYVPHAHNVPLQVGAEFGLVGALAAAIVAVSLLVLVWRGLRSASAAARAFAWASLLGSVYLFGQSLVDAYIHQPAILLAFALPIARLDALVTGDQEPGASGIRRRGLLAGTLLAAVLVSTAAAASVEPAARTQERASSGANTGDWSTASAELAGLTAAEPNLAPVAFLAGLAAAQADDPDAAATWFERAATLDDFAPAWVNLAAARARLGDEGGARAALERALRLGRQQPRVAVAAAGLFRELGDVDAARDALSAALAVAPSLVGDGSWTEPAWADVAVGATQDAQDRLGSTWNGFVLALERGNTELASGIAGGLGGTAGEDARLAARAWEGDEAAFADLVARARARPLDGAVVGLCRRVAQVGREQGRASWSCDQTAPTDAYPVVRLGVPRLGQVMPGRELEYHAPYAYRRVLPQNLLVLWVLQLEATNP